MFDLNRKWYIGRISVEKKAVFEALNGSLMSLNCIAKRQNCESVSVDQNMVSKSWGLFWACYWVSRLLKVNYFLVADLQNFKNYFAVTVSIQCYDCIKDHPINPKVNISCSLK